MQGANGSGKSQYVFDMFPTAVICSADDYFVINGKYEYDESKAREAHRECMMKFLFNCNIGSSLIVVDNTNTKLWEMSRYVMTAAAFGYDVEVISCVCDSNVAASRSGYNLSPVTIKKMTDTIEKPLDIWPCTYRKVITG